MTKRLIYLDNSATTRISDAALEKYIEVSKNAFGNPSSLHGEGFSAESKIEDARKELLSSLGAKEHTAVFTASGSEANNLAIFGRAFAKERYKRGAKIITTDGEHASVGAPFEHLKSLGYKVAYIPTRSGKIDLEALRRELTSDVILVSIMMVNNETGAYYDTARVKALMKAVPEAVLHLDATQSYMKLPFTIRSAGADMMTVSSHKIHGPKGVGALVVDKAIIKNHGLAPMILGGGQEGGLRSGTENVPGIAAFGFAIKEALRNRGEFISHTDALRKRLIEGLSREVLREISPTLPERYAPHIINLTLPAIKSETMLHFLSMKGIYVSSGSACSSNGVHTSGALVAYGRSAEEADSSIRISFSLENTEDDVDALLAALAEGIKTLARKK